MVVGDLATQVDVVVLGAGPGGYVSAIRAAQLGKQVVIINPGPLGGVCLNAGCIPSKALLTAADRAWQVGNLPEMGIIVDKPAIDLPKMQTWKQGIIDRLVKGVGQLLAGNGVDVVGGRGWFLSDTEVRVEGEYGAKRFAFEQAIIATGASPEPLPGLPFDGERVLTPGAAFRLASLPPDVCIVGSGYIAAEQATFFAKLGVPVRLLIPAGQKLLSAFEQAAVRQVQARLKRLGVKIERDVGDMPAATAEAALVVGAAGLRPNTADLHLDAAGVQTDERGFVTVNAQMQSSAPHIYAVGDVTGGLPQAAMAIKQAKVAAESLAGRAVRYLPQAIPKVAWTEPGIASVGLTVAEAEAAGYTVVSGRFPLGASGRALTLDSAAGFGMTVAEAGTEILLGATFVGPQAPELIGEAALALEMGATLTDLAETLHPHPGLSEALQESAEAALGAAVHILM